MRIHINLQIIHYIMDIKEIQCCIRDEDLDEADIQNQARQQRQPNPTTQPNHQNKPDQGNNNQKAQEDQQEQYNSDDDSQQEGIRTRLGKVRITRWDIPEPSGWRVLRFQQGQQILSQLQKIMDEWSIVAFQTGKLSGQGYGFEFSPTVGSECGQKFIIKPRKH